jgi:ribosomal protein S18 acetylase RimI-like enzyme
MAELARRGAPSVTLQVGEPDLAAQRLYVRLGFRATP